MKATLKFEYDAPRWADFEGFIKQRALYNDCEAKLEIRKSWITETGTVVCSGEIEKIKILEREIKKAMLNFNKD